MYFSFTTIQYYMQMLNRQIRSREFIVGIDQVVQLIILIHLMEMILLMKETLFFLKKLLQKQALKMKFWLLLMMLEQTHKFQLVLSH